MGLESQWLFEVKVGHWIVDLVGLTGFKLIFDSLNHTELQETVNLRLIVLSLDLNFLIG